MRAHFVVVSIAIAAYAVAEPATARSYPAKPIRILAGFAAGGGTDTAAPMVAQKLSESLGQPFVLENRAGSGGIIVTEAVAKVAADVHTFLIMAGADSIQPVMRAKLSYGPPKDFSPISLIVSGTRRTGIPSFSASQECKQGLEGETNTPEQSTAMIQREVDQNIT